MAEIQAKMTHLTLLRYPPHGKGKAHSFGVLDITLCLGTLLPIGKVGREEAIFPIGSCILKSFQLPPPTLPRPHILKQPAGLQPLLI